MEAPWDGSWVNAPMGTWCKGCRNANSAPELRGGPVPEAVFFFDMQILGQIGQIKTIQNPLELENE
jgi:hypothetical protein